MIKNIQFEDGPLGHRELTIKWKEMKCYQRLEVLSYTTFTLRRE